MDAEKLSDISFGKKLLKGAALEMKEILFCLLLVRISYRYRVQIDGNAVVHGGDPAESLYEGTSQKTLAKAQSTKM